jgi:hypothetical protein
MATQADVKTGTCLWCEMKDTPVNADGLCDMCREPVPEPRKTFDTSAITERLAEIDARFLEPLIKKAADNFYCQVLDTVDDYLIENLDFNMSSHIRMLERENQRMRTELWEVDKAIGCHSLGHETRINAIKELHDRHNQATAECWRLRGLVADSQAGNGPSPEGFVR